MRGIPGPKALSPEWHSLRRFNPDEPRRQFVFGATDAAVCCGMSPYRTPLELFMQRRGLVPDEPDNDAMRMGRRLEPVILDEYESRTKKSLLRGLPMYFHEAPEKWFMAATPDAVVEPMLGISEESAQEEHGVDAKSSTFRRLDKEGLDPLKFGEEGTDHIPVDYIMQGQQQCEVLGLPYVEFPVLFDTRTLRIYRVERDDELIVSIFRCEKEMAERIINNDPPEPTWSAENTREMIGLLHGHQAGKVIDLSEESIERWRIVSDHKAKIKALEEEVEELKNKILWEIGDANAARFPQGTKELRRIAMKAVTFTVEKKAHFQLRECKVK